MGFCGDYTGPVLEHPGRGLRDYACVGLANYQVYSLGDRLPHLYWQQAELRTDGACRIMMMMMMSVPLAYLMLLLGPQEQYSAYKHLLWHLQRFTYEDNSRTVVS